MIDVYNKELTKMFNSSEFKTFLISKIKYCPGTPTMSIGYNPNGKLTLYTEYSTMFDYPDSCESPSVPEKNIVTYCFEFLKMKNPEIYEFVTTL